ncbi:MAG: RDD family protein [Lysobacterales bacterium CG02_land_8_20_14_3_00_62_12]|nr:MAG: RDD family protein [Xanthomonadales bacterium CG02_land_8_20_14_3_00_62_12]
MPMTPAAHYAPLWKRLLAGLYDLFPLVALWMIATALWMPFSHGQARLQQEPLQSLYRLTLIGVTVAYYAWSWHRGGATIGMRAWRLRVQTEAGALLSFRAASGRFAFGLVALACAGIGLGWALFDRKRRMWHDLWPGTVVVVIAAKK